MRHLGLLACAFGALMLGSAATRAAEPIKMNYLIAAPFSLPSFGPYQIARYKGYYRDAGLDVSFVTTNGGAEVAKQVGAGNADLGGGIGDTPIIVRQNGLKVRGVALLGGKALTQIVVRQDAHLKTLADLKGKAITVQSYQDTTYYTLLGVLAQFGLSKNDVTIQAPGPAGMSQLVAAGSAVALAGTPDRGILVEEAGVPVDWYGADEFFPATAPSIIASDEAIRTKPQLIRAFVQATLHGLKDVMADPQQAAKDFVAAAPSNAGKEKQVEAVLAAYDKRVYPGQAVLGAFDADRLGRLQDAYLKAGIIQSASPVGDLFTNEFVK